MIRAYDDYGNVVDLAEHDKQIRDKAYQQGIADERERIIRELEEAYNENEEYKVMFGDTVFKIWISDLESIKEVK